VILGEGVAQGTSYVEIFVCGFSLLRGRREVAVNILLRHLGRGLCLYAIDFFALYFLPGTDGIVCVC